MKTVWRENYSCNTYIKKQEEERAQSNNLTLHLKELRKEEHTRSKLVEGRK
jgi:hypothetical protein